jgi:hypothetical protein
VRCPLVVVEAIDRFCATIGVIAVGTGWRHSAMVDAGSVLKQVDRGQAPVSAHVYTVSKGRLLRSIIRQLLWVVVTLAFTAFPIFALLSKWPDLLRGGLTGASALGILPLAIFSLGCIALDALLGWMLITPLLSFIGGRGRRPTVVVLPDGAIQRLGGLSRRVRSVAFADVARTDFDLAASRTAPDWVVYFQRRDGGETWRISANYVHPDDIAASIVTAQRQFAALDLRAASAPSPGMGAWPSSATKMASMPGGPRTQYKHSLFVSDALPGGDVIYGRLVDSLQDIYGAESVISRDAAVAGDEASYRRYLDQAMGRCKALLLLVGPHWLQGGGPTARGTADRIRLQVQAARRRGAAVIPLLVQGATMPPPEQVPADLHTVLWPVSSPTGRSGARDRKSLRALVARVGLPLRGDPDFTRDLDRLTTLLSPLASVDPADLARSSRPNASLLGFTVIFGLVALFFSVSSAILDALSRSTPSTILGSGLVAGLLLANLAVPFFASYIASSAAQRSSFGITVAVLVALIGDLGLIVGEYIVALDSVVGPVGGAVGALVALAAVLLVCLPIPVLIVGSIGASIGLRVGRMGRIARSRVRSSSLYGEIGPN